MTDDFTIIYQDAFRLKTAVLVLAGEHKNNVALWSKIHAAVILLERCDTVNQLQYACDNLRQLFRILNHREPDNHDELFDIAQSQRGTSVRHSPQTRDDRAEWRRNVDSDDKRAQGLSVRGMEAGREPPEQAGGIGGSDLPPDRILPGVAKRSSGPLQPQQKRHRAIRRKTKDRLRRTPVEYHSEVKKVD